MYSTDQFCTGGTCDSKDSTENKDKGVQLSFGICAIIAFVGLFWSRTFTPVCAETASLAEKPGFGTAVVADNDKTFARNPLNNDSAKDDNDRGLQL